MKKLFTIIFTTMIMTVAVFAQVNVTFEVDMTGQTVSPDGVHLAGTFNGWNTSSDMLTDQGSNIYAITLSLTAGEDYEYKYLNGNAWGLEESAPAACTVGGNNRIFTSPAADMTLDVVPFNGCPTPNPSQSVVFTVDMSGLTVSADGVYVTGNFNGWLPGLTEMTPIGDDFYQATVTVLSTITNLQYKYLNGNAWGTEEAVPAPCANANVNRDFIIEGAGAVVDLPAYEFGTCNEVAIPLPVELIYFEGKEVGEGVALNWQTATEDNNQGFQIERSLDGKIWEDIDFVKGNGISVAIQNYNFVDNNPFANVNYYRLKQLDFDGQFEYSNIVLVDVKSSESRIVTYPNPVQNELNIINAAGQVRLYNVLGQPVRKMQITDTTFSMDLSGLVSGTYLLVIEGDDGSNYTTVVTK